LDYVLDKVQKYKADIDAQAGNNYDKECVAGHDLSHFAMFDL